MAGTVLNETISTARKKAATRFGKPSPGAKSGLVLACLMLFCASWPLQSASAEPDSAGSRRAQQAAIAFAPPVAPQLAFAHAGSPAVVAQDEAPAPMPAAHSEFVHAPKPTASADPRSEAGPPPDAGRMTVERHVRLIVNKSKNLHLDIPYSDAAVAQPAIADVVPISDRQLYILGKKIGSTNILLYDDSKHLIGVVDVDVRLDIGAIAREVRRGSGGRHIRIGEVNGDIVLSGDSGDAQTADRAMTIAQSLLPGGHVVNAMSISSPQQVELEVRFVEASRQAVRNLGVRWAAFWHNGAAIVGQGGGLSDAVASASGVPPFASILARLINSNGGSLDMVLNALEKHDVVRRLASPNLVALSGQSADFLAGGKFPVPVSSSNAAGGITGSTVVPTITIQWQTFGIRLKFTPTVLANGVISLRLEPEVSDIDPTLSVNTGGVAVPGLVVRRADTTVELRNGQAFAIAGLMSAKSQRTLNTFPWLGTVPVLGALFSSKDFESNETELVVIVSPHLVKPVAPGHRLKTPLDNRLAANDVDMFLNQRLEVPKRRPTYVQANGQPQMLIGGMAPGAPTRHMDPNRWHWPWESQ